MLDVARLPPEALSVAERISLLLAPERAKVVASLTEAQAAALKWDWGFWARPDQLPPEHDDWRVMVWLAGRGSGKTRAGTEWVRKRGPRGREGVIIGANPRDVRDVLIEHGPSSLLRISPPDERPTYQPSKLLLQWPNGAIAHVRSGEDPEGVRGLSVDWAFVDELAKHTYDQATWDNLRFAMREGTNPQTAIATTPKPTELVKKLIGHGTNRPLIKGTVLAPRVSTFRNAANLAPEYLAELMATYEGTRLGEQEIHAVILEDVEGALWERAWIDSNRLVPGRDHFERTASGLLLPANATLWKVAVGVDPSGSSTTECGIVAVGSSGGRAANLYVLGDRSLAASPHERGKAIVRAYVDYQADVVVCEKNFGGDMAKHLIDTTDSFTEGGTVYPSGRDVRVVMVNASRGKAPRAEPVAGIYQQGRAHHLGTLAQLEAEQLSWVPGESTWSPNRIDGLVWACTWLIEHAGRPAGANPSALRRPVGSVVR